MKNKKILLVGLTVCMVISILISSIFISKNIKDRLSVNIINQFYTQEKVVAEQTALTLRSEILNIMDKLYILAQLPEIKYGKTEVCEAKLIEIFNITQLKVGNLGRVNKDGIFQCSLNKALIGIKAEKLGSYIPEIFNDPKHTPVISRAVMPPGAPGYLSGIHVPVFDKNNKFIGTLGGAVYFNELKEKILLNVKVTKNSTFVLLDDDGTILYHQRNDLIGKNIKSPEIQSLEKNSNSFQEIVASALKNESGTIRYTFDGVDKIAAFAPVNLLPNHKWIAIVTVPLTDVNDNLYNIGIAALFNWFLALQTVVVIVVILLFLLFSMHELTILQKIDEMKSDFISLVSHQLKTPVAQIKGFVANMLDGLVGDFTPKQKEYLNSISNVANKNAQLIDDLLDTSRIERGMLKVNREALDMNTLLDETLSPLREIAKKKGVILDEKFLNKSVTIIGDPVKTREALRNIIDNAIKFTSPGKKVSIIAQEEAETVVVVIADQGPGVDQDVQKELFEKNRVWTGKVKASGAGLGLFLSKQFIELTGGTISFTTEIEKGTIFKINFPKKNNGTNK